MYTHAKLDHSSFSCSGDKVGAHQNLNGLRHISTLLSGIVAILGLALATCNLSTKFEVSISAHYENMKGERK